ncbi:MAG: hypothetical protein PVG39_00090 [Desulfobacteraceae bacterium]|jgi:hypothetical protein
MKKTKTFQETCILINSLFTNDINIIARELENILLGETVTTDMNPEKLIDGTAEFSHCFHEEDILRVYRKIKAIQRNCEKLERDLEEEDIPVMEEFMDADHIAKPDTVKIVAIKQPDGSTFITDNVQAEMTCKCGKSKLWMHAGQISTPCPYCRRQYLAVHHLKTGQFKFIHCNAWWRTLWYKMIGRSQA